MVATHTRRRLASVPAQLAVLLAAAACGGGGGDAAREGPAAKIASWRDGSVNVVSSPVIASGVTAVTALGGDGRLRTVATDVATGRRLWTQPATMAGRPTALGVQPPAVTGPAEHLMVVDVEAHGSEAALVGRDAHSGTWRWSRPIGSTFGPARCGEALCLSEDTAGKSPGFALLDPATGRRVWRIPGIAEVEWSNARQVVLFRTTAHPTVEAHDLASGKPLWAYRVDKALGHGVDLSGGWSFGSLGGILIGYVAPFQKKKGGRLSPFGFFSLRLADGTPQWARRRLIRIYPSASPAVALITREVDPEDRYAGFVQLDPRDGRTMRRVPTTGLRQVGWWLAFPPDLSALGFLVHDQPGHAYDLRTGRAIDGRTRAWSFCADKPVPLKIDGQRGFYPVAALCPFDVRTGRRLDANEPPPGWYTGATDGWRVWRDESGALRGVHDASGTSPGMYR